MRTSIAASSPVSALVDIAQAPLPPITRLPPTATAITPAELAARKARRSIIVVDISFPPLVSAACAAVDCSGSAIAPVLLQDLDLVAVGILDEKELVHQRAVAMEFLYRIGVESALDDTPMLSMEVRHRDCDVPIAIAMPIGFGAAVMPPQLDLEIVCRIAQIDQRDALEIEPGGRGQPA